MGVLNVTPDSFSDGGRYADLDAAVGHGVRLRADGADLVDIGGESTRPGAERVDAATEAARVLPVIRELAAAGVPMSIDTTRAAVAAAALAAGAAVVNDVSGGLADPDMARVVARRRLPVGADALARALPADARAGHLRRRGRRGPRRAGASASTRRSPPGSAADRIIVDPGLGFAKTAAHNWQLSARLPELLDLGFPVLFGASRKSYLGRLLADPDGTPAADRRAGGGDRGHQRAGGRRRRLGRTRARRARHRRRARRLAATSRAWPRPRRRAAQPTTAGGTTMTGPDHADRAAGARPARRVRLRARAGPGLRGRRRPRAGPRPGRRARDDVADTVHYGELAERLVAVVDRRAGQPDRDPRRPAARRSAWPTRGSARATVTVHKPQAPIPHDVRRRGRHDDPGACPVTRAVLSLGSNLGDRLRAPARGRRRARRRACSWSPGCTRPRRGATPTSPRTSTRCVLVADRRRDAARLAGAGPRRWSGAAGRVRDPQRRFGPRTLDVDVIAVWDDDGEPVLSDDPELTLPHPRAHLRAFVLRPWIDIQPYGRLPGHGWLTDLLTAGAAGGRGAGTAPPAGLALESTA